MKNIDNETILKLQDNAFLLKGLSNVADIYRQYTTDNPDAVEPGTRDAIETFFTTEQIRLSNEIKATTDKLL